MKKLKLLLTAFALLGGVISASAQTVPVFQESNSFGGTAVSSLTTFVPNGTTYTLELTGCTSGTEITVPGGSFSYTPTTSGTVRFVRFGSTVYVYEGTTYKGTVEVSTPAAPTYPTGLTSASSENLIQNGGFEDTTDGTYTSGRYKPTHWTPYNKDKGTPDDGVSVRPGSEMTDSYNMLMHNAGYYLTQQLASGVMKNFTPYQISYNYRANGANQAGAKYRFQVGSEEFKTDYFSSNENNKGTTSVQTFTATFTTPATIVDQPYVQLYRTGYVSNGANQDLDRFDEFILVAANGGGIGITGATGATFLSGKAYAPEGVLDAEVDAERYGDATMRITNPTFDSNNNGWTSYLNASSNQVANNKTGETENFWENWNSSAKEGRMFQVITDLPSGTYELQIMAFADQLGTMTPASTAVAVYAQGQEVGTSSSSYVRPNYVNSTAFTYYKTYAYVNATGKLEIGMRQYLPAEFGWLGMDNVTLKYIATDNQEEAKMLALYQEKWTAVKDACNLLEDGEYTNVKGAERANLTSALSASVSAIGDYATNAATLKTAYLAFKAGKTNWDLFANEISKADALGASTDDAIATRDNAATTAADVPQAVKDLKVTEYNYVVSDYGYAVSLGSWNSTGPTGSLTDQHWSGESREYLEQSAAAYSQDSWDIVYDQDLALPAGNYVFKVAGRQANSDKVTLSLTVKNGESVIGTVADFPKGDNGLGINKSGATSFDSGDAAGFANSNNGRGWEWRYVKFTLASDATVKVSVEAHATAKSMWVSFCDATVQTDNEANIKLIAYNIALASAQSTLDNQTYKYVGGTDRSNLSDAIDADATLDKTDASAIDAATTALNTAKETFTAGVASWNAYVLAKNTTYADDQPYASAEKYAAIATAKSGTVNTASEAATKAAAITSAYRLYVESNALAEGVTGAEDKTSLISDPNMDVTYDSEAHTFGAWQVFGQTDGTISLKTEGDQPLTDSDGNKYKYADIWKTDNNGGIKQTVNLPAGKYMLTAAARAQNAADATFGLFAGAARTEISRIDNVGGVYGNGWNDASVVFFVPETSNVEIGVQSGNGKAMWWGATRFRLVRLGDAVEEVEVSTAGFATYVSDVDLDYDGVSGLTAYKASVSGERVILESVTKVPAGEGVVLKGDKGTYSVPVTTGAGTLSGNALVRGTGVAVVTSADSKNNYVLSTDNDGNNVGFYQANGETVPTNRAYLQTTAASPARLIIVFEDEATGISTVQSAGFMVDGYYDLQGRRVAQPTKGLYIQNGKKVFIK